jgi:hypothetical protein
LRPDAADKKTGSHPAARFFMSDPKIDQLVWKRPAALITFSHFSFSDLM